MSDPGGRFTAWDEAAWNLFAAELDAWQAGGRRATFWWRDDDAGSPHPGLERVLALAARAGVPLGLAVVPDWLTPEVKAAIAAAPPSVVVLQHGWAHANHEPPAPGGGKVRPAEFGPARPPDVAVAEATAGWARLRGALGERAWPAFVPPWNRIAPAVVARLPAVGYRALSGFGPRATAEAAPGLHQLNCHADPIRWREARRFAGPTATLARLREHLADRRTGRAHPEEATGLLTHHRDMDAEFWAFLEEWLTRVGIHRGAAFPPIPALLEAAVS
ncbi:MAG TPA: polysaccharide deacetylase family protein [Methylomirabilota bacterium]|jgi:hypothetical protein|nr:polysaccharide deacetylase family protein [Methylomirabilota bacterium]